MKTRINHILTAAFLFAGASAFGDIEVIDSLGEPQKWSDATTWVEETKPTLADEVFLQGENTTLIVDGNSATMKRFVIQDNQTLNLKGDGSGVLNLANTGTTHHSDFFQGSSESSVLNIYGGFEVASELGKNWSNLYVNNGSVNLIGGTGETERAKIINNRRLSAANAKTNLSYSGYITSGGINGWAGGNIVFRENSNVVFSQIVNVWNGNSAFVFENNSSVEVVQGFKITAADSTLDIAGKITTKGAHEGFTFAAAKSTFRAAAEIDQQFNANGVNYFSGNTTVESGVAVGALKFANDLYVGDNVKLTLNSSNAFNIGRVDESGALNAQSNSFIKIATVSGNTASHTFAAANFTIENKADNAFGGFEYYAGSSLTLVLDSSKTLSIGAISLLGDSPAGDFSIFLDCGQLGTDKLFLGSDIFADENIKFFDATETSRELVAGADYVLREAEVNGIAGYYMNNPAVPEPATCAVIFGIFALAFTVWRKRR